MNINRKTPTATQLEELENGSACTMVGYMPEELHLYIDVLEKYIKSSTDITVFEYKSEDLNAARGTNLQKGLNMFSISLDDMYHINEFAIKERFQYGFRWLDDVADNNRAEVSHVA
jgi:hypothetical protein